MPEQPNAPPNPAEQATKIRIIQINLNKSERAHLDIINGKVSEKYDIMLIQEPHATAFNAIRTPTNFRPIFPSNRFKDDAKIRSVIWVNKNLETKHWKEIDVPNTNDITAMQLTGTYGKITIFNIYNDCTHSRTERTLKNYLTINRHAITEGQDTHMIWAGDFNRHHPLWDDDKDTHLFTTQALRSAEGLIELMAEYGMTMALPKGIPTLQHMRSKKYSRPDNVLCTATLQPHITKCTVDARVRPTSTDHFPIVTNLDLPQTRILPDPSYNFRTADWDDFNKTLANKLNLIPRPERIRNAQQLEEVANNITRSLQETIKEEITQSKPRPDAKRWWNSDLNKKRKELNRLRKDSYKNRTLANHPIHRELRRKSRTYGKAIVQAKKDHWTEYLEEMTAGDIWTANKYLKSPVGDGGTSRIPTIRTRDQEGNTTEISNNEDKARTFAKTFFPPAPQREMEEAPPEYPDPLPNPPLPSKRQIDRIIRKLSPFKAPGPDGIPNVVLQKSYNLIADYLSYIYQAVFDLDTFYDPWREFTTIVLKKPDKPNYEIPKAYRPIALISTMAKVLTAIVAENISQLVELHQLIPKTHFGGRPGRTTTDAIHYLVHKVKKAWGENQVASVLFLDVEAAFPNAVTDRLIHNLRKRRIPEAYTRFIRLLLTNRRTKLKFDDFTSETINIDNGIGQGDPLSMILYILYNADLLEITDNDEYEDAIGYVDDVALLAIGNDFEDTTRRLKNMMDKQEGGLEWSKTHNSRFEISKSAVLHLTRKTIVDPEDNRSRIPLIKPPLMVSGQVITEVQSYKYLGIQIDTQLRWKEQVQRAVSNATKWLLQYRRLTKPSTGTNAKLMRQLYIAVALPKITYGLDIWYTPPNKKAGQTKNTGSAAALRQLQKTQRIATLAITGAIRTTPNDFADTHAGVLPIELALLKATHRSLIRLLTLPPSHPLHSIVVHTKNNPPRKHASPIANLLRIFKLSGTTTETIVPIAQMSSRIPKFTIKIAGSRKESIEREKKDSADFRIYSDGSGMDGGIGAAAVLYTKERATPIRHLKKFLGPPTKRNTYEAEIVGAILATWILNGCPETNAKNVSLYIDNQSVLASMNNPKATSGQYLIRHLNLLANSLACNLEIHWISSHSKVKGNEKVDELAKTAANGLSSASGDLPHILRTPLPTSASAIRQAYHTRLMTKWENLWADSDRRERVERIDENFPFTGYRKRTYKLTRLQASLMTQIRCGHIPLNAYLIKINRSETDLCQACLDSEDNLQSKETVKHFLFECPTTGQAREEAITKIGRSRFNLKDIMSSTDHMTTLAKFIEHTGRFKSG
jgi:ribonuclease HI/exonuclease III